MKRTVIYGHTIESITQDRPDKLKISLSSGDIVEIEAMFIAGTTNLSLLVEYNGKPVEGL